MKVFIAVLVLIFSFQSWTKADDISDFEIEGMSIGDSLLDYFSEEKIKNKKKTGFLYPNKDFYSATFRDQKKFELYEYVQSHIRKNDNKYIIYSIGGQIDYPDNVEACYKEMEKVNSQFKKQFEGSKFEDTGVIKHSDKVSGTVRSIFITLESGDEVVIECYDWTKETNLIDNLLIVIDSKEFSYWLHNKAYN